MGKKDGNIAKELILLKLAQWTTSLKWVNKNIKFPFVKLLCYAVYDVCSPLSSWTEFNNVLSIKKETIAVMNRTDAAAWAKDIKKRYPLKKRIFSPRLTYKYLFIAEVFYIHALLNRTIKTELLDELCLLFSMTKNWKSKIVQYAENYLDPEWILQTKAMKKCKDIEMTIPLLCKFVFQENNYYQLPRRNVLMFSTMSSGKSTFVNALLGHDYLPSKNEVCTAKVASISDIDHIDYCLGYAVKNHSLIFCQNINQNKMLEWNNDPLVSEIIIEGNLDRISSGNIVTVIHDTPGVNYSGNTKHKKLTINHLIESRPDIIICLLDATQMHTTDFSDSLEDLKKANVKDGNTKIFFVINKADNYDFRKENLEETIVNTVVELKRHGFANPIVIPVSSRAGRLFKMALHGRTGFTENEIDDFSHYVRFFSRPENDFSRLSEETTGQVIQSISYSSKDKADIVIDGKSYKQEQIIKALFCTGIPVIENLLNAHKGEAK